jgi:hypothetical protein
MGAEGGMIGRRYIALAGYPCFGYREVFRIASTGNYRDKETQRSSRNRCFVGVPQDDQRLVS